MENRKPSNLSLLLGGFRDIEYSSLAIRSLINDLGSDAEILSDALHSLIINGDFGCPEDGVKAIFWAMMFDAAGQNFLHDEFDALRNGAALDYLLQELPCLSEGGDLE